MTRELNVLLTALYVLIDDHVLEAHVGRDWAPLLSDSELITGRSRVNTCACSIAAGVSKR